MSKKINQKNPNKQSDPKPAKKEQSEKCRRVKQSEFMEIMDRLKLIDKETKAEKELFNIKIKSLELEKEYLWNLVQPQGWNIKKDKRKQ